MADESIRIFKLRKADEVVDGMFVPVDSVTDGTQSIDLKGAIRQVAGQSGDSWKAWSENNGSVHGEGDVTVGKLNTASGGSAYAFGANNQVSGDSTAVVGFANTVDSDSGAAIGSNNNVTAVSCALAGGVANTVSGQNSVALGYGNSVAGSYSMVMGCGNAVPAGEEGSESNSVNVVGSGNTASASDSIAFGNGNHLTAANAVAIGLANNLYGEESAALGYGNTVNHDDGMTVPDATAALFGRNNTVTGEGVAIGKRNTATKFGTAVGQANTVETGAVGIGTGNSVFTGSYAVGQGNRAYNGSSTMGQNNYVDAGSYAFGQGNTALNGGHAFGQGLYTDMAGHAIGKDVRATNGGIAIGNNTSSLDFFDGGMIGNASIYTYTNPDGTKVPIHGSLSVIPDAQLYRAAILPYQCTVDGAARTIVMGVYQGSSYRTSFVTGSSEYYGHYYDTSSKSWVVLTREQVEPFKFSEATLTECFIFINSNGAISMSSQFNPGSADIDFMTYKDYIQVALTGYVKDDAFYAVYASSQIPDGYEATTRQIPGSAIARTSMSVSPELFGMTQDEFTRVWSAGAHDAGVSINLNAVATHGGTAIGPNNGGSGTMYATPVLFVNHSGFTGGVPGIGISVEYKFTYMANCATADTASVAISAGYSPATASNSAVAIGGAKAEHNAVSVGLSTYASGYSYSNGLWSRASDYAVAEGIDNYALGNATAYGYGTKATDYAFAAGASSSARAYSIAVGRYAYATDYGISLGQDTYATKHAVAVGDSAKADDYSAAFGWSGTQASHMAFAAGYGANAADNSMAVGQGYARNMSVAVGWNSPNADNMSVAVGISGNANNNSGVFGHWNTANNFAYAFGASNQSYNGLGLLLGWYNEQPNDSELCGHGILLGYRNKNYGYQHQRKISGNSYETMSFIAGTENESYGINNFAFGTRNIVGTSRDDVATDLKGNPYSTNDGFAFAYGYANEATRNYDMAIGFRSKAHGGENIAIGGSDMRGYRNIGFDHSEIFAWYGIGGSTTSYEGSIFTAAIANFMVNSKITARSSILSLETDNGPDSTVARNFMLNSSLPVSTSSSDSTRLNMRAEQNILISSPFSDSTSIVQGNFRIADVSRNVWYGRSNVDNIVLTDEKPMMNDNIFYGGSDTSNITAYSLCGNMFYKSKLENTFDGTNNVIDHNIMLQSKFNISAPIMTGNLMFGVDNYNTANIEGTFSGNIVMGDTRISGSMRDVTGNIIFGSYLNLVKEPHAFAGREGEFSGNVVLSSTSYSAEVKSAIGSLLFGSGCSRTANSVVLGKETNVTKIAGTSVIGTYNDVWNVTQSTILGSQNKVKPTVEYSSIYNDEAACSEVVIGNDNKMFVDSWTNKIYEIGAQNFVHGASYISDNNKRLMDSMLIGFQNNICDAIPVVLYSQSDYVTLRPEKNYILYPVGQIEYARNSRNEPIYMDTHSWTYRQFIPEKEQTPAHYDFHSWYFNPYDTDTTNGAFDTQRAFLIGAQNVVGSGLRDVFMLGSRNLAGSYIGHAWGENVGLFAFGDNNIMGYLGCYQFAFGESNKTSGHHSYDMGLELIGNQFQTVVGKYNSPLPGPERWGKDASGQDIDVTTGALFIVGNGHYIDGDPSDNYGYELANHAESFIHRSNAMVVYQNGDIDAAGVMRAEAFVDHTGKSIGSKACGRLVSKEMTGSSGYATSTSAGYDTTVGDFSLDTNNYIISTAKNPLSLNLSMNIKFDNPVSAYKYVRTRLFDYDAAANRETYYCDDFRSMYVYSGVQQVNITDLAYTGINKLWVRVDMYDDIDKTTPAMSTSFKANAVVSIAEV